MYAQGFSHVNVHLGILLICRFGFRRPRVGPETAYLTSSPEILKLPDWDHTVRSTVTLGVVEAAL